MEQFDTLSLIDEFFHVHYSITSAWGEIEGGRYCQEISGRIESYNAVNHSKKHVGQISAIKVLMGRVFSNEYDPFIVIDYKQSVMDVAGHLYDSDTWDWVTEVDNFYKSELVEPGLLILDRIEILPLYRGKGLGAKAIKDLYHNFIEGCSLLALKAYPLQHELKGVKQRNPIYSKMRYGLFEKNKQKAFTKLRDYYKSLGFENIPGIETDILTINSGLNNSKFEKINLDE